MTERRIIVASIEFFAKGFEPGDYVMVSKYCDGDPGDHWAIGYYVGSFRDRHLVADNDGRLYRYNGFRRMSHVSAARGTWMVEHIPQIDKTMFETDENDRRTGRSVWSWAREPMGMRLRVTDSEPSNGRNDRG